MSKGSVSGAVPELAAAFANKVKLKIVGPAVMIDTTGKDGGATVA